VEYSELDVMAELARRFTPAGFAAFFTLVTGLILPEHHERVIKELFTTFDSDEWIGIVVEMFRGSSKTTVENHALAAWLIGLNPEKSGLIVQVNDEIAGNNSAKIAEYIANNDGWQLIFPHVVPDKEAGWGKQGYFVKKTHTDNTMREELTYPQWQRMRSGTKDPSFVGLGYNSSSIIGKRPYWLIVDDINDEKNTRSERRLREVKDILKGTIFPAANQAKIRVIIGTPWNEADAIHYCIQTGLFKHFKVPVYTDGKPTWPEIFDEKRIRIERELAGEIEYQRMYELDLEKTKGLVLKKEWLDPFFPNEDIRKDWPAIMFIDYTSTADPEKERSDFFALAVGQLAPGGRKIVISDGIYKRLTHLDAQRAAVAKILEYPSLLVVGVEAVFAGNEYGHALEQNQELIDNGVFPELCRGGPWMRRKGERFEHILADAFRKGTIVLSDAENELIIALQNEWINWQGNALADQGHDDALDAVFGVWHLGKEWLSHGQAYKNRQYDITNPLFEHKKTDYKPIESFFGSRK
jgi:hypothetical protein